MSTCPPEDGLRALEQRGRALSATDAHGNDAAARVASTELGHEGRGELGAGAAELTATLMAERDRAAVDVQAIGGDLQLALAINRLAGERLVELDDVDVADAEAGLGEELAHRGNGADAHDLRRHA